MRNTHPGYEWEKGKAPRRVMLEDIDIPEATGRRKKMIEATDRAQERKRKVLNKWSKHK